MYIDNGEWLQLSIGSQKDDDRLLAVVEGILTGTHVVGGGDSRRYNRSIAGREKRQARQASTAN